jgi:hypothetical protein
MPLKNFFRLIFFLLLAVSVTVNIVFISGRLDRDKLVGEKTRVIERFSTQVKELEEKNRRLAASQEFLETRLNAFVKANAAGQAKLAQILAEYNQIKTRE